MLPDEEFEKAFGGKIVELPSGQRVFQRTDGTTQTHPPIRWTEYELDPDVHFAYMEAKAAIRERNELEHTLSHRVPNLAPQFLKCVLMLHFMGKRSFEKRKRDVEKQRLVLEMFVREGWATKRALANGNVEYSVPLHLEHLVP